MLRKSLEEAERRTVEAQAEREQAVASVEELRAALSEEQEAAGLRQGLECASREAELARGSLASAERERDDAIAGQVRGLPSCSDIVEDGEL